MRGRGCGISVGLLSLIFLTPALADSGQLSVSPTVPSGQAITLHEVLLDDTPGALWARFRFVAPAIAREGGSVSYDLAGPDMDHLCADLALAYLKDEGLAPARVVISLADRPVVFGDADPDATQFFEIYRPEGGTCIWEEF